MSNKNYKDEEKNPLKSDNLPDDLPPETYLVAWVFVFGLFLFLAIILIAIF